MLQNKEIFNLEKKIEWLETKTKYKTLSQIHIHDGQPDILAYIYMHPDCTQYEIARYLGLSRASIGISIKRMQKSGYIEVKANESNKRSTCVRITKEGTRILVKSDMVLDEYISKKFEGFSEKELEAYVILQKKVLRNLSKIYKDTSEDK